MKFPNRETVERVRREYPAGTRVELVRMEDVQAPPTGTKGTVTGVDDTASVMVAWDNGSRLHVVYGEDACRKLYGKDKVDSLFEKIVGFRFDSYGEMEEWFRRELGDTLPQLNISECDGVNAEIENGMMEVDFSTDCTFGEDIFGMQYADFSIDYIMDNEKKMYVTYARWN